jgi:hypothetical protein
MVVVLKCAAPEYALFKNFRLLKCNFFGLFLYMFVHGIFDYRKFCYMTISLLIMAQEGSWECSIQYTVCNKTYHTFQTPVVENSNYYRTCCL